MSNPNVSPLPSQEPASWLAPTAFFWAFISLSAFVLFGEQNIWIYYLIYITGPVALLTALAVTALLGVAGHSMKRAFVSFFVAVAVMLVFSKELGSILNLLSATKSPS